VEEFAMSLGLMQQIDFNEFHRVELQKYLNDGRGAKAAVSMAADRSLTFVVGDGAWTYRSTGVDIEVVEGRVAGLTISLDPEAFSDFVNEMWSVFGLLYGERLTLETGSFEHLVAWEPVLQSLWFDRPIYAATESSEFVGRNGAPLSLNQSFTLNDDTDEMSHFLQTCGYLVLRNVFSAEEIAEMNEVVERERQRSTPDDKRSWWATDSDGNEVCCRVTYLAERDQVFADLAVDDRLKAIAALSGAQLLPCPDRLDGLGVVIRIRRWLKACPIFRGIATAEWADTLCCALGSTLVFSSTKQARKMGNSGSSPALTTMRHSRLICPRSMVCQPSLSMPSRAMSRFISVT